LIVVVVAFVAMTLIAGIALGTAYITRPLGSVLDGIRDGDFKARVLVRELGDDHGSLVASSPAMTRVLDVARRASRSTASVLESSRVRPAGGGEVGIDVRAIAACSSRATATCRAPRGSSASTAERCTASSNSGTNRQRVALPSYDPLAAGAPRRRVSASQRDG
jgi:hypothetical protein